MAKKKPHTVTTIVIRVEKMSKKSTRQSKSKKIHLSPSEMIGEDDEWVVTLSGTLCWVATKEYRFVTC